jgi:hypothetical protein
VESAVKLKGLDMENIQQSPKQCDIAYPGEFDPGWLLLLFYLTELQSHHHQVLEMRWNKSPPST